MRISPFSCFRFLVEPLPQSIAESGTFAWPGSSFSEPLCALVMPTRPFALLTQRRSLRIVAQGAVARGKMPDETRAMSPDRLVQ
jgi:hypothetical protein